MGCDCLDSTVKCQKKTRVGRTTLKREGVGMNHAEAGLTRVLLTHEDNVIQKHGGAIYPTAGIYKC